MRIGFLMEPDEILLCCVEPQLTVAVVFITMLGILHRVPPLPLLYSASYPAVLVQSLEKCLFLAVRGKLNHK